MFCTGGIRCEKASSFMLEEGFEEVYHLQGGILKYLETIPEAESLWQGECFVFDQRVAVTNELKQGKYNQCFACRHPLSPEEIKSKDYSEGISCSYCIGNVSETKKNNLKEVRGLKKREIAFPIVPLPMTVIFFIVFLFKTSYYLMCNKIYSDSNHINIHEKNKMGNIRSCKS